MRFKMSCDKNSTREDHNLAEHHLEDIFTMGKILRVLKPINLKPGDTGKSLITVLLKHESGW